MAAQSAFAAAGLVMHAAVIAAAAHPARSLPVPIPAIRILSAWLLAALPEAGPKAKPETCIASSRAGGGDGA
ncbi:hypothetical protein AEB_P1044 [Altererythrobacter sp. B11]|nr:hypothetical protein AEB_P1044 [Altererythrobacter sp. B11]